LRRAHPGDQGFERGAALPEELAQPHALARPRRYEFLQRLAEEPLGGLLQLIPATRLVAQYARPAQHIECVQRRRQRQGAIDHMHGRQHALEPRGIDVECPGSALRPAVADGAVDLAATQLLGEARAQLALGGAQLIRQAEADLEEAMVDAAQLAHQRAPASAGLAAREAGHARDHVCRSAEPQGAAE
jgi:hypothetical protein